MTQGLRRPLGLKTCLGTHTWEDNREIIEPFHSIVLWILNGKVARDFWSLVFLVKRPHMHTLNYFRIWFRLREDIRKSTVISVVGDSAEPKKLSS
jgi:hypothetical protein